MDIIGKEELDKADDLPMPEHLTSAKSLGVEPVTEEEFSTLLKKMENPVDCQKEVAVRVKLFLDHQINTEMKEKGVLSESTRRWVNQFNNICETIQKALYGDKSVNLHVVKVTHSDIAKNIRKYRKHTTKPVKDIDYREADLDDTISKD